MMPGNCAGDANARMVGTTIPDPLSETVIDLYRRRAAQWDTARRSREVAASSQADRGKCRWRGPARSRHSAAMQSLTSEVSGITPFRHYSDLQARLIEYASHIGDFRTQIGRAHV